MGAANPTYKKTGFRPKLYWTWTPKMPPLFADSSVGCGYICKHFITESCVQRLKELNAKVLKMPIHGPHNRMIAE